MSYLANRIINRKKYMKPAPYGNCKYKPNDVFIRDGFY